MSFETVKPTSKLFSVAHNSLIDRRKSVALFGRCECSSKVFYEGNGMTN